MYVIDVKAIEKVSKGRTVMNKRRNRGDNWLKMKVNEIFNRHRSTIAPGHNGAV